MVDLLDAWRLLHPAIAVTSIFPLIGIVANFAWQTRQRRLQAKGGDKSKIPPIVGAEHNKFGKWLAGGVVGLALIGLARPILSHIATNQVWTKNPFQVIFITLIFGATIASLVLLYQAKQKLWRGVFATLTGMGVVILGFQEGVFRRDNEWFVSHFYIGLTVVMLMIFSLAIMQDIYQDRSHRWRIVHAILNSIALLLFIGQGMTGTRDLLEIPLHWQEPFIYKCDFNQKTCPTASMTGEWHVASRESGVGRKRRGRGGDGGMGGNSIQNPKSKIDSRTTQQPTTNYQLPLTTESDC